MAVDNPAIVKPNLAVHSLLEKGIKFEVKQLWKGQDFKAKADKQPAYRASGVFCEPFEPGICIEDDLTASHRLIFNKYPV